MKEVKSSNSSNFEINELPDSELEKVYNNLGKDPIEEKEKLKKLVLIQLKSSPDYSPSNREDSALMSTEQSMMKFIDSSAKK